MTTWGDTTESSSIDFSALFGPFRPCLGGLGVGTNCKMKQLVEACERVYYVHFEGAEACATLLWHT